MFRAAQRSAIAPDPRHRAAAIGDASPRSDAEGLIMMHSQGSRNRLPLRRHCRRRARRAFVGLAVIVLGFRRRRRLAALAPIASAVIAGRGQDMNRKTVQHQEGGIVKEILVRDGEARGSD